MVKQVKGFVLAGTATGVGKTTVSLALMAALRRRGLTVQGFKCGPDFIDGGYHTRACGRASRNLDGWMLTAEANLKVFQRDAQGADVCLVEGMMGLFDGVDGKSECGSTAQLAKALNLPVILVIDASTVARSVAAMVRGFETFDPQLHTAGIILNKVGGAGHFSLLCEALRGQCGATLLGYLPSEERAHIPERYLGLYTAAEEALPDSALGVLADLAETHIDLGKLLQCAASLPMPIVQYRSNASAPVRIGVARDKAFCFYYEDNLDALRAAGAEIVNFSPLSDTCLPQGIDALYLGGGYPELYAPQLAGNQGMLAAVKQFAEEGLPLYAECGGLMYLAEQIVTQEGTAFPMAKVLPVRVGMTDHLVRFGYTTVDFVTDCLLARRGEQARGHSFHRSTLTVGEPLERAYHLRYPSGGSEEAEGFYRKNVLASYIHLLFESNSGLAARFVDCARRARETRLATSAEKT